MGASMALAGFGLTQLSPAGSASRSIHEKRRNGPFPANPLLRDRDAATQRRVAARRHDARRPADQDRRQPAPSRERRRHRCSSRKLLSSISTIRRARKRIRQTKAKLTDRATFEKYLADLRAKIAADGGAGLAFLVEETHSPTRERLRGELEKMFPQMRWCVYDPLLSEAQNFATQMSFGDNSAARSADSNAPMSFSRSTAIS